jgi:outer membrane protein OmpA-like peptidoglycan-associated protein
MNRSQIIVGLLGSLLAISVQARIHSYGAAMDESEWRNSGSQVYCQLRHEIPNYGEAIFSQSVDNELQFSVIVSRAPKNKDTEATLQSQPPKWKHGISARDLGTVDIAKSSQPIQVGRDIARRLMLELEQGMFPTFYYSDWADGKDEVNVAISSVNFGGARKDFTSCLAGLLPYGFKDISKTRVHFAYDKALLSDKTKRRLDKVAKYVKAAADDIVVEIEGHTDAKGFRRYNKKLSLQRAKAVRAYLIKHGVPASQMIVRGFGEHKPAASNRSRQGRAKNRRVVVTLAK